MLDDVIYSEHEGQLRELRSVNFASEDDLQRLVAEHPRLLAGGQINPADPRRFALIKREAPVPDRDEGGQRWSLDHLMLDQDAIPTLVEAKRASNRELRRSVVGQMLDYAANAVRYWKAEELAATFFHEHGEDADDALAELIGEDADVDEFWQEAETNLRDGRIRLVFLADRIPTELQAIIEFLNERTDPTEVLAVELQQYLDQEHGRVLVPRVIGMTAVAKRVKGTDVGYEDLLAGSPPTTQDMDSRLREWADETGVQVTRTAKGLRFHLGAVHLFYLHPAPGELQLTMKSIRQGAPEVAEDLMERLGAISSKDLSDKEPILRLGDIHAGWGTFVGSILPSYLEARRAHSTAPR